MNLKLSDFLQCDKMAHWLIGYGIFVTVFLVRHDAALAGVVAAATSIGRSVYKYVTRGHGYDATEDALDTAMLAFGAACAFGLAHFIR